MKNVISNCLRTGSCLAFSVFLLCTCSENVESEARGVGKLSVDLGISVSAHNVYNDLKAAVLADFMVVIYTSTGTEIASYAQASLMPEVIELEEGSYYVVAHSNNDVPAEFLNDYYYGESEIFTISVGETTRVDVTSVLSNIMVTVVYSPTVIRDFSNYTTEVSNAGGSLSFGMNETRAGYFDEGPLAIDATLEYSNEVGETQTLNITGSISDAEIGKHYEIHIDASLADGSAGINLLADESYETEIVNLIVDDSPQEMTGELLITEILYNPQSLGDGEGEYIELFNNSSASINLNGFVLRRGSNDNLHTIADDVVILPSEYAVLGISASACESVDYVYSGISLVNGGEELIINTYGTNGTDGDLICLVDYGAANFPTGLNGISIQLAPGITDVNQALLGTNWCVSSSSFSTGDFGTPGIENEVCP